MKTIKVAFLITLCLALGGIAAVRAQEATIPPTAGDPKVYGEYPFAYKEFITHWLATTLRDPASAIIEWNTEPKAGEYSIQNGKRYIGYIVDFKVNARNQFGGYTGKEHYRVVIWNGDVQWGGHPAY